MGQPSQGFDVELDCVVATVTQFTAASPFRAPTSASLSMGKRRSFGEQDLTECPSAQDILHEGVDSSRIRACSIWEVMRGCGHVLRQGSEGITGDTYERLSKPAKSIDSFLSHSWRQPRRDKLLELMLVYNLSAAAVAALLGSVLGLLLHWSGALPVISFITGEKGWACKALGMTTYFPVLFFWSEVRGLCSRRVSYPSVFFDKYCINQAFLQEKLEGIKALGATILRSRRLIVLHSRSYFTRLWTVYEIACFMSVHSADRLLLIPEFYAKAFGIIGPAALLTTYTLLCVVSHEGILKWAGLSSENVPMYSELLSWVLLLLSAAFCAPVCFVVTRLWHKELDFLRQTLSNFHIQHADCYAESDRKVVYRLVAKLERSVGQVGAEASDAEALDSFNMRVQQLLAPAVQRRFGRVGVQYRFLATCCLAGGVDRLDRVAAALAAHAPARTVALKVLGSVEWCLLTGPLNIACVCMSARCGVHLRGNFERLTVVTGCLVAILISMTIQFPVLTLRAAAEMSQEPECDIAAALWLAWMAAETAALLALFWPFASASLREWQGEQFPTEMIGSSPESTKDAGPSPDVKDAAPALETALEAGVVHLQTARFGASQESSPEIVLEAGVARLQTAKFGSSQEFAADGAPCCETALEAGVHHL